MGVNKNIWKSGKKKRNWGGETTEEKMERLFADTKRNRINQLIHDKADKFETDSEHRFVFRFKEQDLVDLIDQLAGEGEKKTKQTA